ncbi:hypothetical protein ACOME3_001755 [Neoechinorhynchus agilis]
MGSRTYKIGSIYTRLRGLMEGGVIDWNVRPLWYDVYEAFPPMRNAVYRNTAHNDPLDQCQDPPNIIYSEDLCRARFYDTLHNHDIIDLLNENEPSISQKFIELFNQHKRSDSDWETFDWCVEKLMKQGEAIQPKMDVRSGKH